MRLALASLCSLALAASAAAQKPVSRDALLVSTEWLARHLKDPNLVVLYLGDDNDYTKAHVPGSYHVQREDFAEDHSSTGLALEMPSIDHLRESLGAFGIGDRSRIVVVAGRNMLPVATRMILTLDYAGFGDRTALLDGGLDAWLKENRPTTDVVPAKRAGALAALHVNPVVVDAGYVKAHIGKSGSSIVDARAQSFYDGVSAGRGRDGPQRSGHIASAKSVPFNATFFNGGFVRPTAELDSLFKQAGVAPGDTVIAYCHIGQQATATIFAARLLGHPVRLYDGSFEDWSKRPAAEFPVDSGARHPK